MHLKAMDAKEKSQFCPIFLFTCVLLIVTADITFKKKEHYRLISISNTKMIPTGVPTFR